MSVQVSVKSNQKPGSCECGGGEKLTEAMRKSNEEANKNNIPVGYTKVKEETTTTCYRIPEEAKFSKIFSSNIISSKVKQKQYNSQRNYYKNQNITNYNKKNKYTTNQFGNKYKVFKRVDTTPGNKRNTYTGVRISNSYDNIKHNYQKTDVGDLINSKKYKNFESRYGFDENNRYILNKNNYISTQRNYRNPSGNRSFYGTQFQGTTANSNYNKYSNQRSRSLERSICSDIEQDGNMRYLETKLEINPSPDYSYHTEQYFKGLNSYPINTFSYNRCSGRNKKHNKYYVSRNYNNFDYKQNNYNTYNDEYNYHYNKYYNNDNNYNNDYNNYGNCYTEYNNINVYDSTRGKYYDEDFDNVEIARSQILPPTTTKKTTIYKTNKSYTSNGNNIKNSLSNLRTTGKTYQINENEELKTKIKRYEETEISKDGKFLVSIILDKKVLDEEELKKQEALRIKKSRELNEEQYNLNKGKDVEEIISTIRTRPINYGDNYKYHESKYIKELKPSIYSKTQHRRREKRNVYGREEYETKEIKRYILQPEITGKFKKNIRTEYCGYDYVPVNDNKRLYVQTEAMNVPGYDY